MRAVRKHALLTATPQGPRCGRSSQPHRQRRAAGSARLLARPPPRRGRAGPGAGHCGKGVEDAAWEDSSQDLRAQWGGEGGVGLG